MWTTPARFAWTRRSARGAEINPEDIAKHKGIIANPNCSTIIIARAAFSDHKTPRSAHHLSRPYQAASGAGAKAMEELKRSPGFSGRRPLKNRFCPPNPLTCLASALPSHLYPA